MFSNTLNKALFNYTSAEHKTISDFQFCNSTIDPNQIKSIERNPLTIKNDKLTNKTINKFPFPLVNTNQSSNQNLIPNLSLNNQGSILQSINFKDLDDIFTTLKDKVKNDSSESLANQKLIISKNIKNKTN